MHGSSSVRGSFRARGDVASEGTARKRRFLPGIDLDANDASASVARGEIRAGMATPTGSSGRRGVLDSQRLRPNPSDQNASRRDGVPSTHRFTPPVGFGTVLVAPRGGLVDPPPRSSSARGRSCGEKDAQTATDRSRGWLEVVLAAAL